MPLKDRILQKIKSDGPISIEEYMTLCLFDEKEGYYNSKNILGKDGDFITAPEISQIFGELIALFFLDQWHQAGENRPIHLIECGPGRGVLLKDMVRVFKKFPDFYSNLRISLIECSPILRAVQKETFKGIDDISWYAAIEDVPIFNAYTFIVANEFFDALPIRQYKNEDGSLIERKITVDSKDQIHFTYPDDDFLIEHCDSYGPIVHQFNKQLEYNKGGILIIDYGDYKRERFGDTLQGVKNHCYASIFDSPGEVDISHHVNFRKISELISENFSQSTIKTQAEFLQLLGIDYRMRSLLKNATPSQKMQIMSACVRLVSPQHMGNLFKVFYAASHDSSFFNI